MDRELERVDYRLRADGSLRSAAMGWDGVSGDLLPAALRPRRERWLRRAAAARAVAGSSSTIAQGRRVWCERPCAATGCVSGVIEADVRRQPIRGA